MIIKIQRREVFELFGKFWQGRKDFQKEQGKFGRDRQDSYRAEYEKELKERTESKLNWNIKNRWEQRALDDVIKNTDIKRARFRDFQKIQQESIGWSMSKSGNKLREFSSVDEIFYFMENMFLEGFSEQHISIALDILIRDAAIFEEKDLKTDTFKQFLRELGENLITFIEEENYIKTAKFLDLYCIDDKLLWVNLEMFLIKKEKMFSPKSYIQIMNHFASQNEGSRDFYDFYEFNYFSKVLDKLSTHDLISLGYNFYLVHAGTVNFFSHYADHLIEQLDDSVATYDLLRVLQTFSEISQRFTKLFTQLELLFLKRYDQLTVDELTCAACGFAISGFGTQYFFNLLEKGVLNQIQEFQAENIKEICRGFIFSMRGSKTLLQVMLPRIQTVLHQFTNKELCYLAYSYHKVGHLPKIFAKQIEDEVLKTLRNTKEITLEEIALITNVFCTTRSASRDFHKLLETTILMRMEDLRKNMELLYQIGLKFEESGLCSIDTLKILKKHAFQVELEKDVYE